jgi:Cyclic nucleotide-binding domain
VRRVEAAFLGFGISEYGVWVVVLVYAFHRGGTSTAAAVAVVQLLPAAVVAPVAAARMITSLGAAAASCAGYAVQALSLGIAAVLMVLGAPALIVYVGAVLGASAVTLTRPAQGALLPALVETPAQLTAANVVSSWVPVLTTPALRAIERAGVPLDVELGVVCSCPLFAMLGPPVLEDVARALTRVEAPSGELIVREGDVGDEFFLVGVGELSVSIDGAYVRTLGPGDGFGEIALLHDGIRTATVRTSSEATLYVLQRAPFLEAVTGSRQARRTARELVEQRLAVP